MHKHAHIYVIFNYIIINFQLYVITVNLYYYQILIVSKHKNIKSQFMLFCMLRIAWNSDKRNTKRYNIF